MAEVAAYIREKGYTFSAEHFWHYNDNKGWRIGRNVMKSWRSACETWQAKENRDAARQAHIDAKVDERESRRRIAEGERMNEAAQLQRAKMLGETFRIICRNRYCHPVRHWSIYDEKLSWESAERKYYRHLERIHEVFGVSQVG